MNHADTRCNQATSPDAARLAGVQLGQLGAALPIIYKNTQIQV